jgi:hypothetical protein
MLLEVLAYRFMALLSRHFSDTEDASLIAEHL